MKFYKITARHTQINPPEGRVITCWLRAENEEDMLTKCAEKGIVDIEVIKDDTDTHPWLKEKNK
jgi:hypothetical protein